MRIISGQLKGKPLIFLKSSTTRPLKDSVKENIFNILKHSNLINVKVEKSNILDLYSGVGSFGLESVSRGAKKVTFIEQDKIAVNILKKNLTQLSLLEKCTTINDKVENFLAKKNKEKYNIFFFDPPFAYNDFIENINLIKKKKIFEKKHIVIIHREKKSDDDFKGLVNILVTKKYGRSKIIIGVIS